MSFASAAALVVSSSLRNRTRRLVQQPKYLFFTAVAITYLWGVLGRRTVTAAPDATALSAAASPVVVLAASALTLLYLVSAWVFGSDRTALRFSEAEVQFFFTAPVTRRALVHYRLLRMLATSALGGPLLALVVRPSGHYLGYAVGLWLALTTLSYHGLCASLTRARLAPHGGSKRRFIFLAVLALGAGALACALIGGGGGLPALSIAHVAESADALKTWAAATQRALGWWLFPVAAFVNLCGARAPMESVSALPAPLALLVAHYAWALRSSLAFENAGTDAPRRDPSRAPGTRGAFAAKRARSTFALSSLGRPWVAIAWKNLLASHRRVSRVRFFVGLVAALAGPTVMVAGSAGRSGQRLETVAVVAAFSALVLALVGPHAARCDFRLDLARIDLLRSYPLSGRDVVVGELATPLTMLVVVEWALLVAALVCSAGVPGGSPALRVFGAFALALVLPAVTLCGLIVRNAAVLVLPGWAASSDGHHGLDALGQRVFAMLTTLAVVLFALAPAVATGGAVALGLWGAAGPAAIGLAGVATAAVLLAIAFASSRGLARAFERFDVSAA